MVRILSLGIATLPLAHIPHRQPGCPHRSTPTLFMYSPFRNPGESGMGMGVGLGWGSMTNDEGEENC